MEQICKADTLKDARGSVQSAPHWLMNTLSPQLPVLFEEVLETSGGGALLEEVGQCVWGVP